MGKRSEAAKEFLGNWHIIGAAKNWLGFHVTFNMCDDIRALYYATAREEKTTNEQHFENILIAFNEKRQEEAD